MESGDWFKDRLKERSDKDFRHMMGKKVKFKARGAWHQGKVEFIGVNELHGTFQVTVDRCPIWPVDKDLITIVEDLTKN